MKIRPGSKFLLGLALLAAAATPAARANVTIGARDNIQVGGFFSQGYIKSSGNNYPFDSIDGTFDFREMAVNVSTTFGSHLRVGAQAFAERLGNYGQDKVLLDWAVADYNFRQEVGVRVGRIKFPKGLYGEALDLDMIRPFVFLPQAIYNPVTRDFNASFNGAMVYGSLGAGRLGSFDYKAFYGDIPMNPEQGVADFFNTTGLYAGAGTTALGMDHATGAQLMWSTPVQGLRVGASYSFLRKVYGNGKFAFYPVANVTVVGNRYGYTTFSAEYARNSWTFAAEWERTGDTFTVTSVGPTESVNNGSDSWYLSAARRLNGWLELGTYYSRMENRFAAPGTPAAQRTLGDLALSIRFDISERALFKLEAHHVDGRMGMFNTARTPNPVKKDSSSYYAAKTTLSF